MHTYKLIEGGREGIHPEGGSKNRFLGNYQKIKLNNYDEKNLEIEVSCSNFIEEVPKSVARSDSITLKFY